MNGEVHKTLIKTMLVEDDRRLRLEFAAAIDRHPDFDLVLEASTELEALDMLSTENAEVMILDLDLEQSRGITLLEKIQGLEIRKPFIVVITNTLSEDGSDYIRQLGVDYICVKQNQDFGPDMILSAAYDASAL